MIERFPEDYYPMSRGFLEECILGYSYMKMLNVALYGLARNCQDQMKYNRHRLIKLGTLCNLTSFVVTNGNTDNTESEIISPLNKIVLEDRKLHGSVISDERYSDMAYYRNIGLDQCKQIDSDLTIVLDFDTHGFSYDGIANSVYHLMNNDEIDFIGANGLIYQNDMRLQYDALAFRRIGATKPHNITEINLTRYDRNDPIFRVQSCFGGLGIYKSKRINTLSYTGEDCDHVTINKHLNCYLNPGMIVLYSKNPYEI